MTLTYKEITETKNFLKYKDIAIEPEPRQRQLTPDEEEKRITNIVDWSDITDVKPITLDNIYEPVAHLMKAIPDPVNVSIEPQPTKKVAPVLIAGKEEKKGVLDTFLGFKYPPKPPDWEYASPIDRFNFVTLPMSDALGRIGGKIASDWRMMSKEDVQKLLVNEVADDLEWYQKTPEAVGWTGEKVAEYMTLKAIFMASGLHGALTKAGQKLAAPFIAKEITTAGGIKTVSTLSAAGIKDLIKKGMTSFLTAAPENATFISSWSALDAALKDEPIGEAALSGAGWGLALTAGLSMIAPIAQAPELRMAFKKAVAKVGKRYPGMLDKLGKPVTEQVEQEWLNALSKSRGKDLRLIDLTVRERQMFRNAIRAAEKEIIKAAEREASIKAYWSAKATKKAAEAAKAAAKPKAKVDIKTTETANKIELDHIIVPKEARGQGLGTRAMNDLIDHADDVGKKIELTIAKGKPTEGPVSPEAAFKGKSTKEAEKAAEIEHAGPGPTPQAKPTELQPWEMTQEEFRQIHIKPGDVYKNPDAYKKADAIRKDIDEKTKAVIKEAAEKTGQKSPELEAISAMRRGKIGDLGAKDLHRYAVEAALLSGKPVPPEVLAEYPELQPTPSEVAKEATKSIANLEKKASKYKSADDFYIKTGGGRFDLDFIEKMKDKPSGEIIGKLGDFILSPKIRKALGEELMDVPIIVANPISNKVGLLGAAGNLKKDVAGVGKKGDRTIVINNKPRHLAGDVIRTILEEAAHTKRAMMGREMRKIDLDKFTVEDYEKLPQEISGAKFVEYLNKIREDEAEIKAIWNKAKGVEPDLQPPAAKAGEKASSLAKEPTKITEKGGTPEQVRLIKFYEKFDFKVIEPDDPRITGIRMAREPDPDMQIDKALEKTGEAALSDEELKPMVGQTMPKGIVATPNIGAIKEIYNRVHDYILTFGQARREDPKLYDELMKAYGKRNAGIENAIDQVDKIMPKEIRIDDDVNMAMVYEDKRLSINLEQKETYDKFKSLLDELGKKQQEEGIFTKPFNERMIEENNIRIEKLTEQLKHPNKSKQIARLRAENKILEQMRYLSHGIVARRMIESKVNTLSGDKKKAYLERLSAFYKKRSGKLFLKDYLEAGLITKDDMRMSRLAIEEVSDYYIRSAYKGLYDYGKAKEYIKPHSDELHDEGWLTANELGISSPELKDQIVHPLFGSALAEMKAMRQGRGSLLDQVFGMVKQGQFIKPTIVWIYDAVQKYMRGMYSFNPVTESKAAYTAIRSVLEKDELYHILNESNLFQFPYEISRGAREEEIGKFINQHSAELDRAVKALEKATDTRWFDPDMTLGKMVRNIAMAAHRGMARFTWAGDKMQRTQSYLILRKMGYSHQEAIKVAANSHGGYSLLSEKYKKMMTKKTFVYSFRMLMPAEMSKTIAEPIMAAKDSMGGKKIPKAHWERMVKAVIGTVMMPVAIDEYMQWRGFEKEGKHLGPLAWKWSKEVTIDGETREIVVGINNILNMPVKYWNRIDKYNPIDSSNRGIQVIKNLAKWEVHPIYRIWFWDIAENRRSFGSGVNVYDTEANPVVQFGQISKYVIGQSFRFFGQTMDAMGEGEMTEKERAEQEKIYDSALSGADKMLFWALGYKYIRQPLKERQAIMMKSLQKELTTRAFQYARKYEGEEFEKRKEGLERWARKCEKWIKEEME